MHISARQAPQFSPYASYISPLSMGCCGGGAVALGNRAPRLGPDFIVSSDHAARFHYSLIPTSYCTVRLFTTDYLALDQLTS